MEEVAFITLTNAGYLEFTLNCYESLKQIGHENSLTSYVIGESSYNTLRKKGHPCVLIDEMKSKHEKLYYYRKNGWGDLMFQKIKIVHSMLKTHKYVCITDGDIVFEDPNFMNYCIENIKDLDILFQSNKLNDEEKVICGGFAFIKSNEKTLKMYDISDIQPKNIKTEQDFLKGRMKKYDIKKDCLPLELYPNGRYYYENRNKSPYMIHFNWITTDRKKGRMQKMGKWYL